MQSHALMMSGYDPPTPRTPQEIAEQLAGNTTYREPLGSFGGLPSITPDEIDFALATARDRENVRYSRFARALAHSVATHDPRLWPDVHTYGVPHLLRACGTSRRHRQLVLRDGKVRVRVVLWDAYHALVGARGSPVHTRARAARMRRSSYMALYDFTFAEITDLAGMVMADAVATLR